MKSCETKENDIKNRSINCNIQKGYCLRKPFREANSNTVCSIIEEFAAEPAAN